MRIALISLILTLSNTAYAGWLKEGSEALRTYEEIKNMQGLMFLALCVAMFGAAPYLKFLTPMPYIRMAFSGVLWVIGAFMFMLMYAQFEPYFIAGFNVFINLYRAIFG